MAYSDGASTNAGGRGSKIKHATKAKKRWANIPQLPFGGVVAGGAPF